MKRLDSVRYRVWVRVGACVKDLAGIRVKGNPWYRASVYVHDPVQVRVCSPVYEAQARVNEV